MEQAGRQPETELNPRAEAFLQAYDYPESAEHQAQFDAIVNEAMQRVPEAYQTPLKLGTDIVRWGIWPSADIPYGFKHIDWEDHRNQDFKHEMQDALSWSVSVLKTLNFDALAEAIQEARKPQEAAIRELVKQQIQENPAYQHISTFNSKTAPSERPLKYIERITAEAELRHILAKQTGIQPSELRADRSPVGQQFRRGLYRIDQETATDHNTAKQQPYDRLWDFLARSALASSELSADECTPEFIKSAMASDPDSIPDELLYAGYGTQDLLYNPEQSSPSIVSSYFCDLLNRLIKELEAGSNFDSALESGLEALTDEYMYGLTHLAHLEEAYLYDHRLLMLQPQRLPELPAGILQDLKYPAAGEDPFPTDTTYNERTPTTLAPGATVLKATRPSRQKLQDERELTVEFNKITAQHRKRFATRLYPTIGVGRLLEIVNTYQPLAEGPLDMEIKVEQPLAPGQMPYVEGYDLLDTDAPEGHYLFAKSPGDAYLPSLEPIEVANRKKLAAELEAIGLHTAAEQVAYTDDLALHHIEQILQGNSTYITDVEGYLKMHGLTVRSLTDLEPLVKNDRFYTQCTGSSLLLASSIRIASPESPVRFARGKLMPEIGRKIMQMDHVQVETSVGDRLYRLDATPRSVSLKDTLDEVTAKLMNRKETTSVYYSAAPKESKKADPQQQAERAATFTLEIATSFLNTTHESVIEAAANLDYEDPLRTALTLLANGNGLPDAEQAAKTAQYLQNFADANAITLRQMGYERYEPLRTQLRQIAQRIRSIHEQ